MRKLLLLLSFLVFAGSVNAQQVRPLSSTEIYQHIEQLNVLGTVMYIAAHPDDENTRLLSYLVHHDHVRTIYLSLTRGDGGQNILGDEQGAALGLIRTHELMAARKIDGAEQLFTPVIDFGYTKSPEETYTFWDKQQLTQDVVRAIQQYKPDLLICRFPTTGEGGHGQHTASAFVAQWAYDAIKEHNQQSDTGSWWLPRRLLFNAFRFGSTNTIRPDQFTVEINQYDPLLGEGYGEMAGRSRSVHKSQGAGTPMVAGASAEHFALIRGAAMTHSLYDGIDLSWQRVGAPEIGRQIAQILDQFDFSHPAKSIEPLLAVRRSIAGLKNDFWRKQKLKEIDRILLSCAGVMTEIVTDQPVAVPGSELTFSAHVIARPGEVPVRLADIEVPATLLSAVPENLRLQPDSLYKLSFSLRLPASEPLTQPYWMKKPPVHYRYQYDPKYGGLPEVNPLKATVHYELAGVTIAQEVPLSYKYLDPVKGDVVQRLLVIPAISVMPLHQLFIFEPGKDKTAAIRLQLFQDIPEATLRAQVNGRELAAIRLHNLNKGMDTLIRLLLPTDELGAGDSLHFEVVAGGRHYQRSRHLIRYRHLPELQYFTDAVMKVVPADWACAVDKIGYIEGVGDYVDDVLRLTGRTVELIPQKEWTNDAYLKQFEAIIIGIRALNTQPALKSGMEHLLRYVADGGTLLVQYNKNRNLVTDQLGPYPFDISRNRVTEEHATVRFTHPESALLHFPNTISARDFDHWVQERGVYFPSDWDSRYQTLLSMHDTGAPPLKGAILYTPYGKGQYIYTSLVFFRELPAGNTGAIRLLMNLLSAGRGGAPNK